MLAGWAAADMPGQQGRTVLVTGANSGIGFQVALELARRGAEVLLACRDTGRGTRARDKIVRQVPGAEVELVALDLADLDSVERLAGQIASAPRRVRYTRTARDEPLAGRLWQASETLTGVTFPV